MPSNPNALKLIGKLINVDHKKLQFELICFSKIFPKIIGNVSHRTQSIQFIKRHTDVAEIENNKENNEDYSQNEEDDNNIPVDTSAKNTRFNRKQNIEECMKYLICYYKILYKQVQLTI